MYLQIMGNISNGEGQKGMHLNHDFYVVVGKQSRTENV